MSINYTLYVTKGLARCSLTVQAAINVMHISFFPVNVSAALLYRVFIASAFLLASPMLTIVRKG